MLAEQIRNALLSTWNKRETDETEFIQFNERALVNIGWNVIKSKIHGT